jgi:ATP-dependent DNA helicase RecQ
MPPSQQETIPLPTALHQYFGFQEFRPLQQEAIETALNGEDVLVVMPTGAGKSLCFQLPAALSDGLTLVISPLVALMRDQVEALRALPELKKIGVAALSSLQSSDEQSIVLDDLATEQIRLLYVSPERFRSGAFRNVLSRIRLARFVVDEAHCISEWGHDFRPDYLQLNSIVESLGRPPLMAVTATATARVRESIVKNLGMREPQTFIGGFNRPNLHYSVHRCKNDAQRQEMLAKALPKLCAKGGSGLIYAATRKQCEEVAEVAARALAPHGVRAAAYHAGLGADARLELQRAWQSGEIAVLAATNAFGMGIDKPDVRFVVHYVHPESLESYYQEAGRAGRDGRPSRCVILYHFADRRLREWFIDNDSMAAEDVQTALKLICRTSDSDTSLINVEQWKAKLNWTSVKIRLCIGELERAGMVERTGETAEQWIVRILQQQFSPAALSQIEKDLNRLREERMRRLGEMVSYCKTTHCRRRMTLAYFGDVLPSTDTKSTFCCDNCSRPESEEPPPIHKPLSKIAMPKSIDSSDIYSVLEGLDALWPTVGKARLIKILRGSKAKDVERFSDSPMLGIFENIPVASVEAFILELIDDNLMHQGDEDEYFVCSITPKGRSVWQEKMPVKVLLPGKSPVAKSGAHSSADDPDLSEDEKVLFEELKDWRRKQARHEGGIPAFQVLSNRALIDLAYRKPQNDAELMQVFGIGEMKARKYGEALLDLLR